MAKQRAGRGGHFPELQCLRALLALWVLAAHLVEELGIPIPGHPAFRSVVFNGGLAVDGFVILSGFVIAWSLMQNPRPYRLFLLDRAARLAPVLWACLALALTLLLVVRGIGPERFGPLPLVRYAADVTRHLWLHVALHAVMLHGLVPDQVLANAALAILPPGWSISLEWQFYIVAPALFAWLGFWDRLRTGRFLALVLATIVIAWVVWKTLSFGNKGAFLPLRLAWFLFGAACALAWRHRLTAPADLRAIVIIAVAGSLAFFRTEAMLPVVLWLGTLWLASESGPALLRAVARSRPAQAVGDASYSLYLVQMPMIWLTLIVASLAGADLAASRPALVAAAIVATGLGTAACHVLVEKPVLRSWQASRARRSGAAMPHAAE